MPGFVTDVGSHALRLYADDIAVAAIFMLSLIRKGQSAELKFTETRAKPDIILVSKELARKDQKTKLKKRRSNFRKLLISQRIKVDAADNSTKFLMRYWADFQFHQIASNLGLNSENTLIYTIVKNCAAVISQFG